MPFATGVNKLNQNGGVLSLWVHGIRDVALIDIGSSFVIGCDKKSHVYKNCKHKQDTRRDGGYRDRNVKCMRGLLSAYIGPVPLESTKQNLA